MTGYRQRDKGMRASTSRRAVLTTAALVPVLAGAGAADARAAGTRAGRRQELIESVPTTEEDWRGVSEVMGVRGRLAGGMVYRVDLPRRDLRVVCQGIPLNETMGVGSFFSFVQYADGCTTVMGDVGVVERELQHVIDALNAHGIGQAAVHKHLLDTEPAVWFLHVHGVSDDPRTLARGLRAALSRTGTPTGTWRPVPVDIDLDTDGIDAALCAEGAAEGDIYKIVFARRETITDHGRVLPPMTGATTALSFQPVGGGQAAINGDFVMTADEVQPVVKALRCGGIDIVSLHNHMLMDEPRLFYLHFWAVDDAVKLARTLRNAVDATNMAPASGVAG
ncbi:DUF1259 domain-containing protein [Streptomyces celluloflavus]|nr:MULTISPECIES: DUF1259 domain-containing protein [Streptomyces]WSK17081.1 DUF1259 domain-containing protein [Streptomyces celluloflavus]